MADDRFGELCSLLAALTWGAALVLFKRCGETISPLALNLFKNIFALILLAGTLIVMGEGFDVLTQYEVGDVMILVLSGVIGIAFADTLLFVSLNLVGVGILAIVECLYSPLVILLAALLLFEQLTAADYAGAVLILSAVFISSRHAPPSGRTRKQVVAGILIGAFAMVLIALGIVIAKPVLEISGFPLIWAATLRLSVGTFVLMCLAVCSPRRMEIVSVFRPSTVWKYSLPASFLGTYLAMIFWIAGFKFAKAAVASILNQTSVIFALALAAWFLKERLTRRKLIAVILAVGGALIVTM